MTFRRVIYHVTLGVGQKNSRIPEFCYQQDATSCLGASESQEG